MPENNLKTNVGQAIPLLPETSSGARRLQSISIGEWNSQPNDALKDLANGFKKEVENVSIQVADIPSVWAQPLSMQMAIHDSEYPERETLIVQWKGMIAAIALAKAIGLELTIKPVDLSQFSEKLADVIRDLKPDKQYDIYKLPGKRDPWDEIYVYTLNNRAVGMTSPSTLIVPARDAVWGPKISWWDPSKKIFESPANKLSNDLKKALHFWLSHLQKKLINSHNKSSSIFTLIAEYKQELIQHTDDILYDICDYNFFSSKINVDELELLSRPVELPQIDAHSSHVRIIDPSAPQLINRKPLLITDISIADQLGKPAHDIKVIGDKDLATFDESKFITEEFLQQADILPSGDSLFLPEFHYFRDKDNKNKAFSGAEQVVLPVWTGANKTYYLSPVSPLKPDLVKHVSPRTLFEKTKYEILGENKIKVSVKLTITGSEYGLDGINKEGKECTYHKVYQLHSKNEISNFPALSIWPRIRRKDWSRYYLFHVYYNRSLKADNGKKFSIDFPGKSEIETRNPRKAFRPTSNERPFTIKKYRLPDFPPYLIFKDKEEDPIGIIFPKAPVEVELSSDLEWTVGFDFGTSFTNVFVQRGSRPPERLEFSKESGLSLQVSELPERFGSVLSGTKSIIWISNENFIVDGDDFLPITTALTTKDSREDEEEIILDGRIYQHPASSNLDSISQNSSHYDFIELGLKWKRDKSSKSRLFIGDLCLRISALAAKSGVSKIKWIVSYPNAFSEGDLELLKNSWSDVLEDLNNTTGLTHVLSDKNKKRKSFLIQEGIAVGNFYVNKQNGLKTSAITIDMGGGTSDISIWCEQEIIHHCSIRIAGHHLLNDVIYRLSDTDKKAILSSIFKKNSRNLLRYFFDDEEKFRSLSFEQFNFRFERCLKLVGIDWLRRNYENIDNDDVFYDIRRLILMGISGIYYYVGICLKALNNSGDYKEQQIPRVFIAGNASKLYHWLDNTGTFSSGSPAERHLNAMMLKGSKFEKTELNEQYGITELSSDPKDEVAHGLLYSLNGKSASNKHIFEGVFSGLECIFNDRKRASTDMLSIGSGVYNGLNDSHIELSELVSFLYEFDQTLKDDVLGRVVSPLHERDRKIYKHSNSQKDNVLLWKKVEERLKQTIQVQRSVNKEAVRLEPPFVLALKSLLEVLTVELSRSRQKDYDEVARSADEKRRAQRSSQRESLRTEQTQPVEQDKGKVSEETKSSYEQTSQRPNISPG